MTEPQGWEEVVGELRQSLESMHHAREAGLRLCRSIIQASAKCIRHIHRRQFDEAVVLLEDAKGVCSQARRSLGEHPALFYAGYLQDAEKELVEAAAVLAIVRGEAVPNPESLGVGASTYLNGMGEAASECRRYVLDDLRKGNLAAAGRVLGTMEGIFDDLVTFDYPDALTGGLRRTCDALRAVIERTRSDVTMTQVQWELMQELKRARKGEVIL
ncbi:MAG: hypothetical protein KIT11_00550 [Fimbriimonadaceae bacterium]|nr:hypothetical protein [Fimbriimonadaceae bacterium]QYK55137.1 MAG: hypothetical protein KF733_08985 [Fimbriimonadaceae bacterium]